MLLSDAIDAFLADRRAKGYSKGSIRNEGAALRHLLADVGNIDTRRMRPQHIDIFWASHTGWSEGTMNRTRAHLSVFFKWAQARGYMSRSADLLAGSRNLRVPQKPRVIIPQSSFTTLLESARNPRSRIAVAIGLYLFARISETEDLRWADVNFDTKEVSVYRRKTRTIDVLPLCEELEKELLRWRLTYASIAGHEVQPSWYVIPGSSSPLRYGAKGTKGFTVVEKVQYLPTRRANLAKAIRLVLEEADYFQKGEGGHTLRRSGAVALYNQLTTVGHDRAIRIVQAMLGHSSIKTTEVYLRLSLDRKVRNDLIAGKPMFPVGVDAEVHDIREMVNGSEDSY